MKGSAELLVETLSPAWDSQTEKMIEESAAAIAKEPARTIIGEFMRADYVRALGELDIKTPVEGELFDSNLPGMRVWVIKAGHS